MFTSLDLFRWVPFYFVSPAVLHFIAEISAFPFSKQVLVFENPQLTSNVILDQRVAQKPIKASINAERFVNKTI